ncbi:asparagine synthase-related protein [Stenotrophomonas sp. C3(2023)]|uniref:asparagine synthase-related protein n=1 Tax=Stenotrophomonas sp. C3(2023) TaxID=3080277 RepID=UPI00293C9BD9|nr:asparagine synthase-related protein [Stenotrophomonas sp. C3(2023)]MDV3467676.1 asparagine synthase-related protein [Stenotrophomonas sp. C3(2023)]
MVHISNDTAGHCDGPAVSKCGRYVLALEGECWMLASSGSNAWRVLSAAELIEAIVLRGLAAVLSMLDGSFALALWDRPNRQLSLARDRFGQRNLYYGWRTEGLVFGSSLGALERTTPSQLDLQSISIYLARGCVPAPYCLLQDTFKLAAGAWFAVGHAQLRAGASGHVPGIQQRSYCSAPGMCGRAGQPPAGGQTAALRRIDLMLHGLLEANRKRRPLTSLLTGGSAAALLAAVAQVQSGVQLHASSLILGKKADDVCHWNRAVARQLGLAHEEFYCGGGTLLDGVLRLLAGCDEPCADAGTLQHALAHCWAAGGDTTIALSAAGADRVWSADQTALLPGWASAARRVCHRAWRRIHEGRQPPQPGPVLLAAIPTDHQRRDAATAASARDPLCAGFTMDLGDGVLPVIAAGGRQRCAQALLPWLQRDLVEQAGQLSLRPRDHHQIRPQALQQLLARYLPHALALAPIRTRTTPLACWLRGPLRDWAHALLASASDELRGLDDRMYRAQWDAVLAGADDCTLVWRWLLMLHWHQRQGVHRAG